MADVVVIGGGIAGLSTAYELLRRKAGEVLVLEKEMLPGMGATGACAGGIRLQFSSEVHVRFSQYSLAFWSRFADEMGALCDFVQHGYLFLAASAGQAAALRTGLQVQQSLGVPSRWVTPAEAASLAPGLHVDDLVGGTFCPLDGHADPHAAVQGYARRVKDLGGRIETNTPVTGIRVVGGRVTGVQTAQGFHPAGAVVIAAGPYAATVGRMVGARLPVTPHRRQIWLTTPLPWLPRHLPLTIDMETGWYIKGEVGGAAMMGGTDRDTPAGFDIRLDESGLDRVIEAALHRFPDLADARIVKGWAGLREMTPDDHGLLGRVPGVEGCYVAAGFSGHGFMHGPAVGRALAEILLDGASVTFDTAPLDPGRFASGRSSSEVAVF